MGRNATRARETVAAIGGAAADVIASAVRASTIADPIEIGLKVLVASVIVDPRASDPTPSRAKRHRLRSSRPWTRSL